MDPLTTLSAQFDPLRPPTSRSSSTSSTASRASRSTATPNHENLFLDHNGPLRAFNCDVLDDILRCSGCHVRGLFVMLGSILDRTAELPITRAIVTRGLRLVAADLALT